MFVRVSNSTRLENNLLLGAMSGHKGPDCQKAAVCNSTQCNLKPGGKRRQRQREKQINTCMELASDFWISSIIWLIFSMNVLPINPTKRPKCVPRDFLIPHCLWHCLVMKVPRLNYLLCRWSTKVTVVQSERGTAEQKDTEQLKDVTLASWFLAPAGSLCSHRESGRVELL